MSDSDIDIFATFIANSEDKKLVSLEPIAEQIGLRSPSYTKPTLSLLNVESFKSIDAVILRNFLRNYSDSEDFPLNGLKTFFRIINRADPNGHILKIMMIHLTEANVSVANAVTLYTQVEKLVVLPDEEKLGWKILAEQTIMHPQIIETVTKLIVANTEKIQNTELKHISVKFVHIPSYSIRGFSGINEIYINSKHFEDNAKEYASDTRAQSITQIDVVCIAMHENAQVRLRQARDNFNLSSPFVLTKCDDMNELQFGRMVEKEFFYGQVAWWRSMEALNMENIKSFLTAIATGTQLPKFDDKPKPVYRPPSVVSGIDITDEKLYCFC
ncbi:uncharacterized protein LOC119085039 [Bradysia coprophila]|uniref:uncharacterized protein LOC119085039 n=1 Tax=Bradysia coprophila TaxID=38358 RepID=UPI00187DBFBC|nr:uncharacterized protein LOC119085039 [Bradysia coprophila]